MGYYFESVDNDGIVYAYYSGSPEFNSLDRGPQLPTAVGVEGDSDFLPAPADSMDFYGGSPGNLTENGSASWADFLLSLVQDSQEPPENAELVGIETFALSPVDGSSTSGLKKILLDIIGPYDTVVTQYKYQQGNNSYYTYVNDISPDYPWLCSAALFIALILSIFGLLRRSMSWMK